MAIERLFIGEGVKEVEVKKYLIKELQRAGLAGIEIQRTPLVTRIVLHCDRPALVIGRKGKNVKAITKTIEEEFKIEKPELEIKKVEKPNLEPAIVAYRIASALERGMNSRKVGYRALQSIMRDGAKGAEITLSGKLVGKGGRSRVLKMKAGYMKKCGQPSLEQVLHGSTIATCKAGTIGVIVDIVEKDTHFPDEINIIKVEDFKIVEEEVPEAPKEGTPKEAPKDAKPGAKTSPEVKLGAGSPKSEPSEKKEAKPEVKEAPNAEKKEEKPKEVKEEPKAEKKEEKPAEKVEKAVPTTAPAEKAEEKPAAKKAVKKPAAKKTTKTKK
jgi:small subunit ribosomal protein S3